MGRDGDLELLWTAESLPPPAEDRPEMMMTKPGRQHEEVDESASLGRTLLQLLLLTAHGT
jgi:hypothetical protein